jgi:hypothetical protein
MAIVRRGFAITAVLLVVSIGALLVWPGHVFRKAPAGKDEDAQIFDDGLSDTGEPDAHQGDLVDRINQKEQVALSLIRGEVTFAQAAQRFRELNADNPAALAGIQARFLGASPEELNYRQVVSYVRGARRLEPERVAKLLPRLESEIRRLFPAGLRMGPGPIPGSKPQTQQIGNRRLIRLQRAPGP